MVGPASHFYPAQCSVTHLPTPLCASTAQHSSVTGCTMFRCTPLIPPPFTSRLLFQLLPSTSHKAMLYHHFLFCFLETAIYGKDEIPCHSQAILCFSFFLILMHTLFLHSCSLLLTFYFFPTFLAIISLFSLFPSTRYFSCQPCPIPLKLSSQIDVLPAAVRGSGASEFKLYYTTKAILYILTERAIHNLSVLPSLC